MDNQICEKIKLMIEKLFPGKIPTADYDADISSLIDSIIIVTLIVEIEDAFGFSVNEDDFKVENFSTIHQISKLIQKYVG